MNNAIYDYCLDGGHIYIEGGNALHDAGLLWQVFGLSEVVGGEENALTSLIGQSGSLADGLQYTNSNQLSFKSIDVYTITTDFPGAEVVFEESDYGPVAVQYDGTQMLGQKTFCMSYAIAHLEDGTRSSSRNELLSRILNFFDVVAAVDENEITKENNLKVFPNPAHDQITLQINSEHSGVVQLQVYDLSGRKISEKTQQLLIGNNNLEYTISGFKPGIYYFRLQSANYSETIKWVRIE